MKDSMTTTEIIRNQGRNQIMKVKHRREPRLLMSYRDITSHTKGVVNDDNKYLINEFALCDIGDCFNTLKVSAPKPSNFKHATTYPFVNEY